MSVEARSLPEQPPEELASMTLMEHLRELRSRLIKSMLAVVAGGLIMWFLYPYGVDTLRTLLERSCPADAECRVMATSPIQALSTRLTVSGYGGIALALPFLLWQLWQFITPGLYKREKRLAAPFVISSFLLFLLGMFIAWLTLPKAIYFLASLGGDVDQFYAVNEYTAFVVKTAVGFGIGFEFPVLLVFLQLIGLITYQQLFRWRRYAIVVIVVGAAVITPGGDLFSLFALSIPMYLLYEASIVFGWVRARRRRKANAAVGGGSDRPRVGPG
ncbi:MAG: twin-arginine translocase subunit TatC [Acidimicrobiales bacterium]